MSLKRSVELSPFSGRGADSSPRPRSRRVGGRKGRAWSSVFRGSSACFLPSSAADDRPSTRALTGRPGSLDCRSIHFRLSMKRRVRSVARTSLRASSSSAQRRSEESPFLCPCIDGTEEARRAPPGRMTLLSAPVQLVHRRVQTIHFGEDLVGRFGPGERLRIGVVLGDVAVDRGLQVDDRVEAAAADAAAGEP